MSDVLATLDHPAVAAADQTCIACPEQWEGTLTDGRAFYFRFRHSRAQLGVGADQNAAVTDAFSRPHLLLERTEPGRAGRGIFNSPAERLATFAELLDRIEQQP